MSKSLLRSMSPTTEVRSSAARDQNSSVDAASNRVKVNGETPPPPSTTDGLLQAVASSRSDRCEMGRRRCKRHKRWAVVSRREFRVRVPRYYQNVPRHSRAKSFGRCRRQLRSAATSRFGARHEGDEHSPNF
ncbi:4-hydroxy-tetrahydrodipicolinate synthase [Striga asiatica]|uniref:4-hydroxy-tetrahydrodipicolinate synthase n=1 Tax=Striga asiatica TaxID=4170 RepID=A0A5A7P5I9_STRAF|nr:4-hydroxy-tetrahydrodipicolinate synthase [Striga asiatica]